MYKHQEQVREFHKKFSVLVNTSPTIPSEDILKLRCKLILEETLEFCNAAGFDIEVFTNWEVVNKPDLVEMADAIADIQVINDGTAISLGIDIEPISDEVHRSNMSKLWTLEEIERLRTKKISDWPYGDNWTSSGNMVEGFCVKRDDGKVIKSPSYSPADVAGELKKQGAEL